MLAELGFPLGLDMRKTHILTVIICWLWRWRADHQYTLILIQCYKPALYTHTTSTVIRYSHLYFHIHIRYLSVV